MKILYILWECFGTDDILAEFGKRGYEVECYKFNRKQSIRLNQEEAERLIRYMAGKKYDFVFSFNYFPVVSIACNSCQIKYVAWSYDSPLATLYSNTINFPYNYVFVFDKADYLDLCRRGVDTVYYLPLAAAVDRYDTYQMDEVLEKIYSAPISFVGSTYAEKWQQMNQEICRLEPYYRGYLQGILQAQKKVSGSFIMEEMLTADIMQQLQKIKPFFRSEDGTETMEWQYSRYTLARHLTAIERQEILEMLSEKYKVVLYTHQESPSLPKVINRGKAGFRQEACYIYRSSKINLNITLRSIISGIPLRAFDIMGSGGFLLTNYQDDFMDFFIPGEDFVYYSSYEDLMEKVEYYLTHEAERKEIAQNGYEKVKQSHTYKERIDEIINIVMNG